MYLQQKYKTAWNDTTPEDGGDCLDVFCDGKFIIGQERCYCSAISHPPCSNCEHSYLICNACDKTADEFDNF